MRREWVIGAFVTLSILGCSDPPIPEQRVAVVPGAGSPLGDWDPRIPRVPRDQIVFVARDDPMFHLGLESDVIVEAHGFRARWSQFHEPQRNGSAVLDDGTHRSLSATIDRVLLGALPSNEVRFDFFCEHDDVYDYDVSCSALRRLVAEPDRRAVLFLGYANGSILYLAGHTPEALQVAAPSEAIAALVATRRDARARLERAAHPIFGAQVDAEIARMTRSRRDQYDAMRTLVALGGMALPAIVRHMDDRRALPGSGIMVANPPPTSSRRMHAIRSEP